MTIDIPGLVALAGNLADNLVGLASITYEAWTGQDGWGQPTYAAPVSIKAVIDYQNDRVINLKGIEVTSGSQVTIPSAVTIGPNDRITLPDGKQSPIIKIGGAMLDGGIPATQIWF